MTTVGIVGIGTFFPETIETAIQLSGQTHIPETVLREKMGIRQRHIATDNENVTMIATQAAEAALAQAQIKPEQVNLVISHGSEHKDHLKWNTAAKVQHNIGAVNAYAFEIYALCAGAPIAMSTARGMMLADPGLEYVLLVAGSRENDLINFQNERSRFMFNFGAGAILLKRDADENIILGSSAFTDGSLSEAVILTERKCNWG